MISYVAEIAGKDSIAAIHKYMREGLVDMIIPAIVYTRTEYGDGSVYYKSIEYLKICAQRYGVEISEPVQLHNEKLWNHICVRYQYQVHKRYGFYTPCIMCHLFAHLMRIPLMLENNCTGIITGERFSHNGISKLNQHPDTLRCFDTLFERYNITLVRPLENIEQNDVIDNEIRDYPNISAINGVKCILSGNLNGFHFSAFESSLQLQEYLDEYVQPLGEYLLKCFYENRKIQYGMIAEIIERSMS